MYNATLVYELDQTRRIPVKTSMLRTIDNETINEDDSLSLMKKYKNKIIPLLEDNKDFIKKHPENKGHFLIEYVKGEENREELPVLYSNGKKELVLTKAYPISIDDIKKHIKINPSEIEKARRLLLSSKYKRFLVSFLKDETYNKTTDYKMKISKEEYDNARSIGLHCFIQNGMYGMKIRDAFVYLYKADKLGSMRILVEDALELWKKNLEKMNDEESYYYARSLRVLIEDYYENINNKNKVVSNLKVEEDIIPKKSALIKDINYYRPLKRGILVKKKLQRAA